MLHSYEHECPSTTGGLPCPWLGSLSVSCHQIYTVVSYHTQEGDFKLPESASILRYLATTRQACPLIDRGSMKPQARRDLTGIRHAVLPVK